MDFEIYVTLTGISGPLSCEGFHSIEAARRYVATELVHLLETGDTILIQSDEDFYC